MTPATEANRPLPRQTRPRPGETVESFIHRLARTNHLRPSQLRRLLLNNPNTPYGGSINLDRLATLTGRNTTTLDRAFQRPTPISCSGPTPAQQDSNRRHRRPGDKTELFAAIRAAAHQDKLSIRALADLFRVHRRTIRQALATPTPPARKKPNRSSKAMHGLHGHIDAMRQAGPNLPAGQIWERLLDEHDATLSYSTLRGHLARRFRTQPN